MLRALLLVAGLGVVGYLVVQVGVATVWSAFHTLSWWLLLVVVFPTSLVAVLATLAWRATIPGSPGSLLRLLGVRTVGDALNLVTPTASVGGDPVKALLLRPAVPLGEGLASVVADKTTGVIAQTLILLVALAASHGASTGTAPLRAAMLGLLALQILCVGGFLAAQLGGAAGFAGRLLARSGLGRAAGAHALGRLDATLRSLYLGQPRRVVVSILCHFLAFAASTLEIYLVLRLLGVPISPATAFAVGAFGTAVKFVSFMIPASLGALEGGNAAIFAAFGLGGAAGLTYTLVRRLREIVWIGAGFAALSLLTPRRRRAGAPAASSG
ncbi:MAG: lysylphosphatidylglycerol synthase transmembrane domain-containing protein, partial [Candidatus Rokuibacteriota bacterium]